MPSPISNAVLRRHLASIGKTERLAAHAAALVKAARRAVLNSIPDKPQPWHLGPLLASVRGIVERLRYAMGHMIQSRMTGLAEWGHLSMARVLSTAVKRAGAFEPEPEAKSEGIADYLRLIIRPPAQWVLRQLVGYAPEMLTRLIDPQAASDIVLAGVSQGYDRTKIAKELTQAFGGFENAARRVVRTEGARVATASQLEVSEEIPDMVVGYTINAVPKTEFSRPDHLKRSGTRYYRNPVGDQLGMDVMPQPPIDYPGKLEYNCRCYLTPIIVIGGKEV